MKTLLFAILWASCQVSIQSQLEDYIDKQATKIEEDIHQILKKGSSQLEISYFKQHKYEGGSTKIQSFSFFNSTYFLIDNKIFIADFKEDFKLEFYTKTNISVYSDIKFLKAKQYNNKRFIAIFLNGGDAMMYSFSQSKKLELIHSVSVPYASNAKFFINSNNLYLIITNSKEDYLVKTSIYKWLGFHFDETVTILTTGAKDVSSFSTGKSEILIILQEIPGEKTYSLVYEFRYDKVMKIQQLKTYNPYHIDTFIKKGNQFVIIYEKARNNTVYTWDGFQLVHKGTFQSLYPIDKSTVFYSNERPLILAPQKEKLLIYVPHRGSIKLKETKDYLSNYSVILDINKGGNENGNITFIVGLSEDNIININAMSFKVHPEMENEQENEVLRKCFTNLEENIYNEKRQLNHTQTILAQVKRNFSETNFNVTLVKAAEQERSDINTVIKTMRARIDRLKHIVDNYEYTGKNITIKGNTIIKGSVYTKKLVANDLDIKTLNDKKWTPEQWLRYSEPQTISGTVSAKNISTKFLEVEVDGGVFKDLVFKNGNTILAGKVVVQNMSVSSMHTNKINDITVQDIYLKSRPNVVKGLKIFENVNAKEANITLLNAEDPESITTRIAKTKPVSKFDNHVFIKNLWTEYIDGVNWNKFKDSVYVANKTQTIDGNLKFLQIRTLNLNAKSIDDVRTENFLTTSTDQIVESDIEFDTIYANNIKISKVNKISLKQNAALVNDTIKGPVKIGTLEVLDDIEMIGNTDKSLFLWNGDHIYGTHESDLVQRYTGKVKINANLYVKNLDLQPNCSLFVSGNSFNTNFIEEYWTKSTKQDIPVLAEAIKGISIPNLFVKYINSIKTDQYMLNNINYSTETPFYFENITVDGNVIINKSESHTPDLEGLVTVNDSLQIDGKKIYASTLTIENMITEELDGIKLSKILTTNTPGNVSDTKSFKNMVIKGNLISDLKYLAVINNVNLSDLQNNVIYLDRPQNTRRLNFDQITVSDLFVTKLNGYNFEDYTLSVSKINASTKICIEGDVSIQDVQNVSTINNIYAEEILTESEASEYGVDILGDVKFLEKVKIDDLVAYDINDINFQNLTTICLYRVSNQTVEAPYAFTNIKTGDIYAQQINDVNVSHLVDISSESPQEIFALSGIKIQNSNFLKSVQGNNMLPCDIKKAVQKFLDPPTQEWSKIEVNGNISILNEESKLGRLFKKSVRFDKKNTILAPVTFKTHILAENVMTTKPINNIDIAEIINDALLMDSEDEQVVTGYKIFSHMEASKATVKENINSSLINDVNVQELLENIIDKEYVNEITITGRKTFFGGLQTEKFYSQEVSNVLPENIVTLDDLQKIPSAIFDSIRIENNLNVKEVNKLDVDYILNNRLLTEGPEVQITNATYFFENLEILDNIKTPSINDIHMEDVVFDVDKQKVTSPKEFKQNVEFYCNISVNYLNNINISEFYNNGLMRKRDKIINGSVTIMEPTKVKSTIITETINGYPVSNIKDILSKGISSDKEIIIYEMKQQIENMIKTNFPFAERIATEYMYLETSGVMQIPIPNVIDANAINTKEYVLMHILGEQSHEKCGLPEGCVCSVQHTIEITPGNSVSYFVKEGQQRIYSYDDGNMIVHFITNSISTDGKCRTNKTKVMNEVSSMTWNTIDTAYITGSFNYYEHFITGYISGVQFFTLNNKTYCIVGRYYDPVTDTHDLDCMVIRVNEDKISATEIQKIPSNGAWTIYLLHTAQGVVLVIGNINAESYRNSYTAIYRFDEMTEMFEKLRIVPSYGCTKVGSVILGTDSFIILAHKSAPAQVLKYSPHFDNYYYYQSFELDSPVVGISTFYTGDFGISDAYLCVITWNENYYIYMFHFIDGWKLESTGTLEGLRNLIPFNLNKTQYLFAASTKISSLLTVVKNYSP